MRFKLDAVAALQEAAEAYLYELFVEANFLAIHSNRVTLMRKDLLLARRIRGDTKEMEIEEDKPDPVRKVSRKVNDRLR